MRAVLVALVLVSTVILGLGAPGPTTGTASACTAPYCTTPGPPAPIDIPAGTVDLHDGQMIKAGSTYYLYGTEYGCGYTWLSNPTPWCGFGVSTASSPYGPWSQPVLLFSPNSPDPYEPGHTYQYVCGQSGSGCFSPRMVQRSGWGANDGVWVLWWNGPAYMNSAFGSAPHGYMAMGCNGPTGPCGASAGAPYGTTHRPTLHQCAGANGDAGLTASVENGAIYLVCPHQEQSLSIEQISVWGTDGTGTGANNLAGLSHIEATGTYRDPATGTWIMTYSDPNCGYCSGDPTGYATAPDALGPWTTPTNPGVGAPANGRRDLSATSCGGQPDTISVMDGQAWQKIDLWTGQLNEAGAGLHFEPLDYDPTTYGTGTSGDGGLWRAPFNAWTCQ
jgi:hypothetical protein